MLKSLQIQNYALIRHLEIEPSPNLNIITGETGAGKSIMIGAVGLLLGYRADTKVLYNKQEKCIIEGTFNIGEYHLNYLFESNDLDYSEETIIRREIWPTGKSRAFINDTPVTLDIMKEMGTYLMDIHSQHDTYKLGSLNYQLSLVDVFSQNQDLHQKYQQAYHEYKRLKITLKELLEEAETIRKEADYDHFLYDELSAASLIHDEQELLEDELATLEHAEEIKSVMLESISLLQTNEYAILEYLALINKKFESLASYSANLEEFKSRINSSYLEIQDIARELEGEIERIEHNPARLMEVQDRLNLIYKLLQKHRATSIRQLLDFQKDLKEKVNKNLHLDDEINTLEKKTDELYLQVNTLGKTLSKSRIANFTKIGTKIEDMLKSLGIPDARIKFDHQPVEPGEYGIDEIDLKFSANKGISPLSIKQVASGGEFSRLMFCIKHIIARKTALPTLILDEIDTGISGEIAIRMAIMMKQMADNHQVIAITHLPQIASFGHSHYFVFKDNQSEKSVSIVKELSREERIIEIAKMIGGDQPSDAAYENARELLGKSYIN